MTQNTALDCADFYKDRRVFVTGHTGFKGAWLCQILSDFGAIVTGYSLPPAATPNLFSLANIENNVTSIFGDIRNLSALKKAIEYAKPEIVFHLAAQPLVREGYNDPVYTYEINVIGTVNLLECIRTSCGTVKSLVNVTTDKVYLNREWVWGYREDDILDGFDPYSNSKSCSELVTHSYQKSFFADGCVSISTARAGNVIGGGDFAEDRIIPDCVRAMQKDKHIIVRNPHSIRPYQHVLEALFAYLLIAKKQYEYPKASGSYNVGPGDDDCITTAQLVDIFCDKWGDGASWGNKSEKCAPYESGILKLDCSKLKASLGWKPRWTIEMAVEKAVEWSKVWLDGGDVSSEMKRQIKSYVYNI